MPDFDISKLLKQIEREAQKKPKEPKMPLAKGLEVNTLMPGTDINNTRIRTRSDLQDDLRDIRNNSSAASQLPTVVIITALHDPECKAVLRVFNCQWASESREGILYRTGIIESCNYSVQIVIASQNEMGMVPAAILTTKAIVSWHPSLIAMTGVCAGVREKGVNLGDLIVARQVLDYGSGKLVEKRFVPDYSPILLDSNCAEYVKMFSDRQDLAHMIRSKWEHEVGRPQTEMRLHFGVIASGAAVIAKGEFVEEIQEYKRSILGIDMEAYGVAKAAESAFPNRITWMIIKGIQDYADNNKSDEYREYSAFVSAQFLRMFLEEHMSALVK